jgi:uncharacterized protein (TIGR00299 family) protein
MATLALDGRMGAAGDMILGALLAAGGNRDVLAPIESALDVEYSISTVQRSGIQATSVDVVSDHGESIEGSGPTRSYTDVVDIVTGMGLANNVEADAVAIFELLGDAEATVHGTDRAETHFHEVGADDAIADVVGTAALCADLGIDHVVTTPVAAGGGTVETAHGTYPVPAPAVVQVAEQAEWSLTGGPVDSELLTPTGAAILAHFATGVAHLPSFAISSSGYGAGDREYDSHPNVLRAIIGEREEGLTRDEITVLETNLDDASPELLGSLQRSLADVGARDVSILPTTMKKSRPGHLVKVICKPADAQRVARRLAEETGTLGVREHGSGHRWMAERALETVTLSINGERHEINVKIARTTDGDVYDISAEFDDAAVAAEESGLPVRELMRRAEQLARE